MRNGWGNSIRCSCAVRKKKNHSKPWSGFTARTFSLSGRVSAMLQRRGFHTFPPTWCETDAKRLQETESSCHDPDPKDRETSLSDIQTPLFPSLVVEKKVAADKRSGTNRSLPYKWDTETCRCSQQLRTTQRNINTSDIRGLRSKLIMTLQIEWAQVSLLVYLCLHLGLEGSHAESESAPMWRKAQRKMTGMAHIQTIE